MKLFVRLNIFFILINVSCSTKSIVKDGIIGSFAIDSLNYLGDDAIYYCLNLNDIIFKKNNEVELPSIIDRHKWGVREDKNVDGKWEIIETNNMYKLKVISSNNYFNGLYSIRFKSNSERTKLILMLYNENLTLYGTKDWFGYSNDKNNINKLIELNN